MTTVSEPAASVHMVSFGRMVAAPAFLAVAALMASPAASQAPAGRKARDLRKRLFRLAPPVNPGDRVCGPLSMHGVGGTCYIFLDPHFMDRSEAAIALLGLGDAGTVHVAEGLRSRIPAIRFACAHAMASSDGWPPPSGAAPAQVRDLARVLDDRSFEAREAAAVALGKLGAAAVSAELSLERAASRDAMPEVRRYAGEALLTVRIEAAMEALRKGAPGGRLAAVESWLRTGDPGLRSRVLAALAGLGPAAAPAAPVLFELLALHPEPAAAEAAAALARLGPAAEREGLRILRDGPSAARLALYRHIPTVLLRPFPGSPGVLAAIAANLGDPDHATRLAAATTLAAAGDPAGLPVIVSALNSPDLAERHEATRALDLLTAGMRAGGKPFSLKPAVPGLAGLIAPPAPDEAALRVLGRLGADSAAAAGALVRVIEGAASETHRLLAARALAQAGPAAAEAAPDLERLAASAPPTLRAALREALDAVRAPPR